MRFTVVAGIVLFAAACGSKGGGESSSGAPGTWSQVYSQVIAARCAPCHTTANGAGVVQGKLDMTSQATAYTNLVDAAAAGSACAGIGTRVVPSQPDSSILYLKVSHDDASPCGAKMPASGGQLTQDQVDLIESWIKSGAPNN